LERRQEVSKRLLGHEIHTANEANTPPEMTEQIHKLREAAMAVYAAQYKETVESLPVNDVIRLTTTLAFVGTEMDVSEKDVEKHGEMGTTGLAVFVVGDEMRSQVTRFMHILPELMRVRNSSQAIKDMVDGWGIRTPDTDKEGVN
jgi:hypothetical protein